MATKEESSNPEEQETKLTPKQQLFVKEYLIDLNARQAAIRAGYSEKTASEMGYENLNKPQISSAIQKAMDERSKRTEITADRVLEEIAKMGFANMEDYVSWNDGAIAVKSSSELTRDKTAAISEISESVGAHGSNIKIKLHDKKGSLELLGRHLKLFTDKVEHSGSVNLTDMTDDELARKRLELERQLEQSTKD